MRKFLKYLIFTCFGFFCCYALEAKVLIMTHCYNKPEFISWQFKTFQKFLKSEYEFVVFNDAPNPTLHRETKAICDSLGILSINVPQKIHKPPYYLPRNYQTGGASAECAETIQYMLNTLGFDYNGIVLLIDSDMFLIKELDVEKFMDGYDLAAHPECRKNESAKIIYFLPNLIFFNMKTLQDKRELDFNLGEVNGVRVDTAGYTSYYIKSHPNLKWLCTSTAWSPSLRKEITPYLEPELGSYNSFWDHSSPNFQNSLAPTLLGYFNSTQEVYDHEFYLDYTFLHFRAGSNWNNKDSHWLQQKTLFLYGALKLLIDNCIED